MFSINDLTESVRWPLTLNSVIDKYCPLKTIRNYATRTISDVKEVALETDSMITTWHFLRNNPKTQVSASADKTSESATLLADQKLASEDFHLVLSKICTKGRPCFSDKSTKECSICCSLHTLPTPKAYWILPTSMGSIPTLGLNNIFLHHGPLNTQNL